jgi:hypothetical protein
MNVPHFYSAWVPAVMGSALLHATALAALLPETPPRL